MEVPRWLASFTPVGIEMPIQPSGVFPEIEPRAVGPALSKMYSVVHTWAWAQQRAKGR